MLGRGPDDRPIDGLIQWRQEFFGVQVFHNVERAGHSSISIVTPDLADTRQQLALRGLTLAAEIEGDFGKIAQISDPEGNEIMVIEPPKGM